MLQIFIVFHKKIFDECYKDIPDDILSKYFTFIAVNKDIIKEYTLHRYNVINEWDLPIYDNRFQERGYNENSAIYHVYANKLHEKYKYIGFFQYDMKFTANSIESVINTIRNSESSMYFPIGLYTFEYCAYSTWGEINTCNFVLKDYEQFFGKPINRSLQFPLWNSYIIPNNIYSKIMKWIITLYDKLYPWCNQYPNQTHKGHIGGIYERIMAFALGNENIPSTILDINHDHGLKAHVY